jgi:integrase
LHRIAFAVVSEWCQLRHSCSTILPIRSTPHLKDGQQLTRHASIQRTLNRYNHWMPSMGGNTAEGIDEALG